MMDRLLLMLCVLPAGSFAQAQSVTDQQILTELKGVRAVLEKLESGQKALMALARIQIDESRVAYLEAQRLQLSTKEQELSKEAERAAATLRGLAGGSGMAVAQAATGGDSTASLDLGPYQQRLSQATQKSAEATRARQTIEQTLAVLRSRIAAMEKALEGAGR
jgi:hypothetical protein